MKYFAQFRHSLNVLTDNDLFPRRPLRYTCRAALWYLLVAIKREPFVRIKEWSSDFILPCLWRTPAKVFYVFRRDYESEVHFFENAIMPGDHIIDIGANFGLYTLLAANKTGQSGVVLAFEPFPLSFEILQRNCARNNLSDIVTLYPCALGSHCSTSSLSIHSDPGRNSLGSLGSEEISRVEIQVETLDNVLSKINLAKIDFIKMDVEGFESHVLQGSRNTIAAYKPTIVFELNPGACERSGENAADILQFIEKAGYCFFRYLGERELTQVAPKDFGNYVAIHQSRLADVHFEKWHLVLNP